LQLVLVRGINKFIDAKETCQIFLAFTLPLYSVEDMSANLPELENQKMASVMQEK